MKRTLATFAVAYLLLAFFVAVPERLVPEVVEVAPTDIDFSGIDTVRVEGHGRIAIEFADAGALSWPSDGEGEVTTRRDGGTLVVASTLEFWREVQLKVPESVTRIDLDGGSIASDRPLDALTIHVRANLDWEGDVRHLRVVDSHVDEARGEDDCVRNRDRCDQIAIEGDIEALEVETVDSLVNLVAPDRIGRATLRLWPRAGYIRGPSRSPDRTQLVLLDAAGQEQPTGTTVGFADEAAMPAAGDEPNDKTD